MSNITKEKIQAIDKLFRSLTAQEERQERMKNKMDKWLEPSRRHRQNKEESNNHGQ
jgi:hypothetical protein